jgi:predicted enzyme related to lactoylglutathione lyase
VVRRIPDPWHGGRDRPFRPPAADDRTGAYTEVADINAANQRLVEAGAAEVQKARDVGQGKLVASIKDADGNMIGIMHTP